MQMLHHDARDGVTGSCHQLIIDVALSLLIDCGLFKGAKTSANGKTDAERLAIVNYLNALLGDQCHNILFVGYQAKGTPRQIIQQYGPRGG